METEIYRALRTGGCKWYAIALDLDVVGELTDAEVQNINTYISEATLILIGDLDTIKDIVTELGDELEIVEKE